MKGSNWFPSAWWWRSTPGRDQELVELRARSRRLEQRLLQLEQRDVAASEVVRVGAAPEPTGQPEEAAHEPPPVSTPEEEKAREDELWEERLVRFEVEARDPTWSRQTESRWSAALVPVAEQAQGKISGVECRSSRCRAFVDWQDGKVRTMADARALVEASFAIRKCVRHVDLSDPRRGRLMIECQGANAEVN